MKDGSTIIYLDEAIFNQLITSHTSNSVSPVKSWVFKSVVTPIVLTLCFLLNGCSGKSTDDVYIEPDVNTSEHIRQYLLGDKVEFTGTVSITKNAEPAQISAVSVLVEFMPGKFSYLDKEVLSRHSTITFLNTDEQQIHEQDIWQESNGTLFELSNEYGNEYVVGTAFDKGLLDIPLPLSVIEEFSIDFFSMYGGPVSGPITEGTRKITVTPMQTITTELGELEAYNIAHEESYEYLFTYVDNRSGTTVVTDKNMWVSPDYSIIKNIEIRRDYSRTGTLLSEIRWELELKNINF